MYKQKTAHFAGKRVARVRSAISHGSLKKIIGMLGSCQMHARRMIANSGTLFSRDIYRWPDGGRINRRSLNLYEKCALEAKPGHSRVIGETRIWMANWLLIRKNGDRYFLCDAILLDLLSFTTGGPIETLKYWVLDFFI